MTSRLRYEGQGANSLPDGKLKQIGAWSASSDTALEITMEHPASLYLRGFVGSVYDALPGRRFPRKRPMKKKTCITGFTRRAFMEKPRLLNARNLIQDDSLLHDEKGIRKISFK